MTLKWGGLTRNRWSLQLLFQFCNSTDSGIILLKLSQIIVFVCGVRTCSRVCTHLCLWVYAHVQEDTGPYKCLPHSLSPLIFWVRISYWTLSASVWLEYMANGLRESPVFLSLGLGIIDTYHHDWLNVGARDPYKCPHACSASSWPISFSPKFGTGLFVKQSIQR